MFPQVLCYSEDEPQDGTMSHLHRNASPDQQPDAQEPELSAEERLANSRRENHLLYMENRQLQAEKESLQRKTDELEKSLDVTRLPIEEKAKRFQEDPESLGIPKKNPALQRDASNVVPKPRRITEEEFKNMTLEERMAIDPRSITGKRIF